LRFGKNRGAHTALTIWPRFIGRGRSSLPNLQN
jgi:hypothetical protein